MVREVRPDPHSAVCGDEAVERRALSTSTPAPQKPKSPAWLADQFRKQEERRCYVCGGTQDSGGCHGIGGEQYECPWY